MTLSSIKINKYIELSGKNDIVEKTISSTNAIHRAGCSHAEE